MIFKVEFKDNLGLMDLSQKNRIVKVYKLHNKEWKKYLKLFKYIWTSILLEENTTSSSTISQDKKYELTQFLADYFFRRSKYISQVFHSTSTDLWDFEIQFRDRASGSLILSNNYILSGPIRNHVNKIPFLFYDGRLHEASILTDLRYILLFKAPIISYSNTSYCLRQPADYGEGFKFKLIDSEWMKKLLDIKYYGFNDREIEFDVLEE